MYTHIYTFSYSIPKEMYNKAIFFFVFFPFLGPLPVAYGGPQARGLIGAVDAGLSQSHSNAGFELRL